MDSYAQVLHMSNSAKFSFAKRETPRIGGSQGAFIALVVILAVVIIGSCSAVFYLVREEATSSTHTHTHTDTDVHTSAAGYVAANDTIPSSSPPPPQLPLSDQAPRRRWYNKLSSLFSFSSRKERFPSDDDETHQIRSGAVMDRSRGWVQSRGRGDMGMGDMSMSMKERDVDSMMTTTTRTVFSPALDEKVKEKISATSMTPTMHTHTTYAHTHMSGMSIDEESSRVQSPRSSLGFGVGPPPLSTYVPPTTMTTTRASLYSEPALSVDLDDPSAVPGVGMGMGMGTAGRSSGGGLGAFGSSGGGGAVMPMHSPEPKRSSFVVFRPTPRVYSPSESPASRSQSPSTSTSPLGRPGMTSLEPLISATTTADGEEDDDIKQPFATRSGTMVRTPVIGSKFIESL